MSAIPGKSPRIQIVDSDDGPMVEMRVQIPRGVTVGGRPREVFPDPPWASYEEFAAWQASFKAEESPLTVGGYRDNPRPAPTIERAPRWWERALCAVGIHTGAALDVCKRCHTRAAP